MKKLKIKPIKKKKKKEKNPGSITKVARSRMIHILLGKRIKCKNERGRKVCINIYIYSNFGCIGLQQDDSNIYIWEPFLVLASVHCAIIHIHQFYHYKKCHSSFLLIFFYSFIYITCYY